MNHSAPPHGFEQREIQNTAAERRSTKLTALLRCFEDYVNEVVTSNHGMKPEEMTTIVTEGLQRSMQASTNYHLEMAKPYEKEGDIPNTNYHLAMAGVYKALIR